MVGKKIQNRYGINLLSGVESRIQPKPALEAGAATIVGEREDIRQNREIWKYLAWIALIVVMVEWWIYVRRARYAF